MKPYFLFVGLLISTFSFAQPVITNGSNILPVGSSYMASFSSINDIGSSGADQTWDFSLNSFSNLANLLVVDPSSSNFATEYPTANWVFEVGTWTSYFEISATEMNNHALNITATGGAGDFGANPRKILEFPFNFENSFNDIYSENGNDVNLTVTYDAYGTLIMPEDYIYTNVIRVREEEEFGEIVTRYYITEPFMNIAVHFQNQNIFTWIKVPATNSIQENEQLAFSLFPNPVENVLSIQSNVESPQEFSISSLDGKLLKKFNCQFGANTIHLAQFQSGVYFVSNGISVQSFKKL